MGVEGSGSDGLVGVVKSVDDGVVVVDDDVVDGVADWGLGFWVSEQPAMNWRATSHGTRLENRDIRENSGEIGDAIGASPHEK